jgi:hypothetical protein
LCRSRRARRDFPKRRGFFFQGEADKQIHVGNELKANAAANFHSIGNRILRADRNKLQMRCPRWDS